MSDQTQEIIRRLRGISTKATRESERTLWRARLNLPKDAGRDMQEILRAYQDGKKTNTLNIDNDVYFYVVAGMVSAIADDICFDLDTKKRHPELEKISEKMEKVRKKHGLADDEYWPRGEGPEEYEALNAEMEAVSDKITADVFRSYNEDEMADLFLNDREEYDRRFLKGMEASGRKAEDVKKLGKIKADYRKHRKMDKGGTPRSC